MDLTSNDIFYYIHENAKYLQHDEQIKAEQLNSDTLKSDLEFTKKNKPCVINRNILNHMDDIRSSNLEQVYNDQFYSVGFMSYLTDIACPIFYPVDGEHNTTFVKTWLKNFSRIGDVSAEGIAIKGSITNSNDGLFVIKAPRTKSDALAHEAVVGYALAPLRASIPNFSWVYGVLSCSVPLVDDVNDLKTWCNDVDPVTYVVYERVPGVNFKTWLKTCTEDEFLCALMQVVYSLIMAEEYCGFTHYDLHYENIIMRPLDNYSDIKYDSEGTSVLVNTKWIATMIDYGFSRVEIGGKTSGRYGFESFSIRGDRPNVMFDIFKLVCFTCLTVIGKDYPCSKKALEVLKFFTLEQPNTFLDNIGFKYDIKFSLPTQLTDLTSPYEFINYMFTHFRMPYIRDASKVNSDVILNCDYQKCMTQPELDNILHMNNEEDFKDIDSYYVAVRSGAKITEQQRLNFRDLIVGEPIHIYYDIIRTKISVLETLIDSTPIINIFNNLDIAKINIKNQKLVAEYRRYINSVIGIITEYADVLDMFNVLIEVAKDLGLEYSDILSTMNVYNESSKKRIIGYVDNIKESVSVIQQIPMSVGHDNWFKIVLPQYLATFDAIVR